MHRVLLAVVAVLVTAAWASGAQITFNFNDNQSMASAIYRDNLQANTGAETPVAEYVGGPTSAWGVAYALYYADLASITGKHIDCATLSVYVAWETDIPSVCVRSLNTPVMWQKGSGTHGDRWGSPDNGVGGCMVDWNTATSLGHDWGGNLRTSLSWSWDNVESAMGTQMYDNHTLLHYATNYWQIQSLAQDWVNGLDNKGFVLFSGPSSNSDQLTGAQLTITYSDPVPEPATLALLGTGAVAVLNRLRRKRMK